MLLTYAIKQRIEDFIVEEKTLLPKKEEGDYSYVIMEKRGLSTLQAAEFVAKTLRIDIKRIGWAGNKDKYAITRQAISFYKVDEKLIKESKSRMPEEISLQDTGKRGSEPLTLGMLEGNTFTITIRRLGEELLYTLSKNKDLLESLDWQLPNYFGPQRFGHNNADVGKLLIKGHFKEAATEAGFSGGVQELQRLHPTHLLLYVHAYQSLLFNKMLAQRIREQVNEGSYLIAEENRYVFPNRKVTGMEEALPMIGFGTEVNNAVEGVLKEEGITVRNFIIRQLPKASSEGALRPAFAAISDFRYGKEEEDELNKGMKKLQVTFSLPKGSYATVAIARLFC